MIEIDVNFSLVLEITAEKQMKSSILNGDFQKFYFYVWRYTIFLPLSSGMS